MKWEIKKHPLNAEGKFYVDQNTCTCDAVCELEAPNNFTEDKNDYGFYVSKQPETAEELEQMQWAINCCPVEAIHDDGES